MAVEARVESLERKLDHALKLLGSLETSTLGAVSAAARPPPPVDEYGGGTLSALRKAMEQTQPALKSLEEIPGPGAVNITEYNARNHRYLTELHEEYGDIYTMQVPGSVARAASGGDDNAVIFVRAPDDVRSVLTSESFGKTWGVAEDATTNTVDYVHNLIQPMLAGSVFNQQGDNMDTGSDVPAGRLHLRPTFMAEADFADGFSAQLDRALDAWDVGPGTDVLRGCHELMRQSLFVAIAGAAAGELHDLTVATFHRAMDYFIGRYAPAGHDSAVSAEDEAVMASMLQAGLAVVTGWRAHYAALGDEEDPAEEATMLRVMDKKGYTDGQMAAMLVNTLIAGAEAPASCLAQTLQELAFNPPVQRLLSDEVAKVSRNRRPGAKVNPTREMRQLTTVQAAVMEGLRLFAPATLVQRVALQDTALAGYAVPAGTVIGLCVTAVHADAKVHRDPGRFSLERGGRLDHVQLKRKDLMMTFSGGQRGCPGKHLGICMVRIALAKLVGRFVFSPPAGATAGVNSSDGKGIPKFVEWQIDGIPVNVEPRRQGRTTDNYYAEVVHSSKL